MSLKKLFQRKRTKVVRYRPKRNWDYISRKYLGGIKLGVKILFLASVGYLLFTFLFSSRMFKVETIIVDGAGEFVSRADATQLVHSNISGKNIFLVNPQELSDKLTNTFLGAKSVSVKKELPSTIRIRVFERAPIAIVKNSDSSEYYLLDPDGYILGYADPTARQLPNIVYEQELRIGAFIDEDLVPLYNEITRLLTQSEISASSISFTNTDIVFFVNSGPQVLLKKDKNLPEAISAVQALLKQVRLEGKSIKLIDLRYDKVIVSFN